MRRQWQCGRWLAAIVLTTALGAAGAWSAAPPQAMGRLTAEQRQRLDRLAEEVMKAAYAGEMAEALRVAKEIEALRNRWQGAKHWQSVDACYQVENWGRLVRLSEAQQKQVGLALRQQTEGARLASRRRYAEADKVYRELVDLHLKVLGEEHPLTANSYNNAAHNLKAQGKHAQAQPLYQKALDLRRKLLGEEYPDTAQSYNNLASNLGGQGKYAQAQLLHQTALELRRKVLGEEHPATGQSYNNLAGNLDEQGRHAQAQPLLQKALDLHLKLVGEEHPDTVTIYNNLGLNLGDQGKYAQAQPLLQKALDLHRKLFGEEHPDTATIYNNLALNLGDQGRQAQAQPLLQKALDLRLKLLGEEHPRTANSYANLAHNLHGQGKYAQAQPLSQKALDLHLKLMGEKHPATARSYTSAALNLHAQGKHAQAQPLFHKALDLRRMLLGEEHPHTANSYNSLAFNLYEQGQSREAIRAWEAALFGFDASRLTRASSGFDRALAGAGVLTPRQGLVLAHLRLKEPGLAWQHAEANLSRGLLDDLAATVAEEASLLAQIERLDNRLVPLLALTRPTDEQARLRDDLGHQRRDLRKRLADRAADRSARRIWDLARIQKHLPDDAALVLWVSAQGENWGCVLRPQGEPRWGRLLGTGSQDSWTREDYDMPERLHAGLADPSSLPSRRRDLTAALQKRWFDPLSAHLQAEGKLPAVRRLFVVPARFMSKLPVEVIAPDYVVSYVPSGTALAQRLVDHRRLSPTSVLALGDPVFAPAKAAHALLPAVNYEALPGTRFEVESLRRLLGKSCRTLLGSDASEQKLDELIASGELQKYRIVHLATHGTIDVDVPECSALILSRDRLPSPADQAARNLKVYTGELRVDAIRKWKLDADLVVLSACQTGLGRPTSGDGLLGFAYALQVAGARSIVLSRWKVDDTATALLMLRFYENLLGEDKTKRKPQGRADALHEAKQWLRELPRADAEALSAALNSSLLAGTPRGKVVPLNPKATKPATVPGGPKPFAHPYYWAAFTLIGDPD